MQWPAGRHHLPEMCVEAAIREANILKLPATQPAAMQPQATRPFLIALTKSLSMGSVWFKTRATHSRALLGDSAVLEQVCFLQAALE